MCRAAGIEGVGSSRGVGQRGGRVSVNIDILAPFFTYRLIGRDIGNSFDSEKISERGS